MDSRLDQMVAKSAGVNGPPVRRGPIEGPRIEVAAAVGSDSLTQPLHTPQEGTNTFSMEIISVFSNKP